MLLNVLTRKIWLLTLFLPLNVTAQRAYIRSAAGYAWPLGFGKALMLDGYPYTGTGITSPGAFIREKPDASLSAGTYAILAAGIRCLPKVVIELALSEGIDTRKYSADLQLRSQQSSITHYVQRPLLLTPSLVWMNKANDRKPFFRIGIVLPLSRKIYTETYSLVDTVIVHDKKALETAFTVGLSAAAGYSIPLTKHIALSAEVSFIGMSLRITQANLIVCTADGQDLLPTRTQSQLQVEYIEGFVPQAYDPDKPGRLPSYRIPFSNIGMQVGVTIALN